MSQVKKKDVDQKRYSPIYSDTINTIHMRITWWHDFSIQQYFGGAEITDHYWMQTLRDYTLTECIYTDRVVPADLTIIGNHFNLREIPKNDYFVIIHGYHNDNPELYANAKKIIYTSPARQHEDGLPNSIVIAPFVDGNVFRYRNGWRPKNRSGNMYIGRIHPFKGLENLIKWSKENKEDVDVYGYGDPESIEKVNQAKYLHYKGIVTQKQVVDIMNQYQNFVFFPEEKESFCRTVIEAHLCEMNVITNKDKIGAYSFDWDFNNRDELEDNLYKQLEQFKNVINT